MEDQVVSKKSNKSSKKAQKAPKTKTDTKDSLPAISKSMSHKKVHDHLEEAELGDRIEAIISPKTEREEVPQISLGNGLSKLKNQARLSPMAFGSTDQVGGSERADKDPRHPEMHKSASMNRALVPAFSLSPEKGQSSVPKPLLSVLSRLKAGSPLQNIKNVFKKRRRRG
jgi:hypothetical protein